jgi:hypothetical protein
MKTLHIAPGYSAGGSLKQALRDVRPRDEVLCWPDDLSCGPIDSDESSARAAWWDCDVEDWNLAFILNEFWSRVFDAKDKIIVWFARHTASELAFFLNWTDRAGERPYEIIDPTGRQLPFTKRDGSPAITEPTKSVSLLVPSVLPSLLGTERPLTATEKDQARRHWHQLKSENAPFRIVTENGLVSAPSDYFDPLILEQAKPDWQKMNRLIGSTMVYNDHPYFQVGDCMLHRRVVSLIENGALLAEGDPWNMRECRVRLAS